MKSAHRGKILDSYLDQLLTVEQCWSVIGRDKYVMFFTVCALHSYDIAFNPQWTSLVAFGKSTEPTRDILHVLLSYPPRRPRVAKEEGRHKEQTLVQF